MTQKFRNFLITIPTNMTVSGQYCIPTDEYCWFYLQSVMSPGSWRSLGYVDTDLFLWLLSLQCVLMRRVTVGHVVFTVIIRRFRVSNDQQLLDITLRETEGEKRMFNSLHLMTRDTSSVIGRNPIKTLRWEDDSPPHRQSYFLSIESNSITHFC